MNSNKYSAQGSLTIKRLRNNNGLSLTFDNNGIPLIQSIDTESGSVLPDWSIPANQPVRTPNVQTTQGTKAYLSGHSWTYNGMTLNFNGASTGEWTLDSSKKFQINATTGGIKIVENLASLINTAGDTLEYSAIATVDGLEYKISGTCSIDIQSGGSSSYYGSILATTEQLSSDVVSCTIASNLYLAANPISSYYPKWMKDNEYWTEVAGLKTVTVTRDDVDGAQLFICEFYINQSDTTPVARAGVSIVDLADEFRVNVYTVGNSQVSSGNPVLVRADIINSKDNTIYTPASAVWRMDVMDKVDWVVLKTVEGNNITVTTDETDASGTPRDVDVLAEVKFN